MPETAAVSSYSAASYTQNQSTATAVNVVDFLQILVAQLQNQDPLNPLEDKEFVTQLAQFSMLEGINALGTSFTQMQGLELLGKQVVAVQEDSESVISGTVHSVNLSGSEILVGVGDQYVSLDDVIWIGLDAESADTSAVTIEQTESALAELSQEGLETAVQIIDYAEQYLGVPYVMGAESPEDGFDCTGFTQYVYANFGYSLARSAERQGYSTEGTKITSVDDLQIGDLVYLNTVPGDEDLSDHAGIYIGDGQFIHASSSKGCVVISDIDSGYYKSVFSWGIRVLE